MFYVSVSNVNVCKIYTLPFKSLGSAKLCFFVCLFFERKK